MAQEGPLRAALLRAYARWSTDAAPRFPQSERWEPLAGAVGAEKGKQNQNDDLSVPTAPTVPTAAEWEAETMPPLTPDEEERAAILEFEAGLDRATAERLARMSAVAD